ncbi:hypothetical protein RB195_019699 [Necator americanus]|uniref:Structural maintenance of chromosomes protein 5 n=1 Tax=Necator americanus TaxID=51031 RepID=A0ABR1CI81_NECAM
MRVDASSESDGVIEWTNGQTGAVAGKFNNYNFAEQPHAMDVQSSGPAFPDGSITKITYHNFLTYDDVVCIPGPHLNVIIGTNGAGKSTVICGICLAVGGSPKVLGRSERMGDYIKHRRDEGFVEVHIADSRKGEQSIKVLLQRPSSCTYFINGTRTTQRAVRDFVASYNIQIDNPCTFLAQDKVKSFSEQSSVELLMNTERAGNPALLETHENLIKKKKHESVFIQDARLIQQRLHCIEGEIEALLPRVENYKKKESLRTKIKVLQKKKAVLDFKESEGHFSIEEAAMDELQAKVKEQEKQVQQLKKKAEKETTLEEEYHKMHADIERQMRIKRDDLCTMRNINLYDEKVALFLVFVSNLRYFYVRDASERFKRLKTQSDNWEKEMDQMKRQVDRIRENVADARKELEGYEEFRREAVEKTQKYAEEDENLCRLEDEVTFEEKRLSDEINRLRDREKRISQAMEGRLRILEGMRCNMADEAWRWYEQNREKFRYPVYVPILHTTVPNTESAMLLENLIAIRDFPMFIFGCKADEAILTDQRHKWKLNSTVVPSEQVDISSLRTVLSPEMKKFGFNRFAVDLFTAPDVVKQYLCNVARLHQVPIGSSKTNDAYEAIKTAFVNTPFRLYLTDRYRVQFTVSKYGSHEIIGQQSELRMPARIFVAHSSNFDESKKLDAEKQDLRSKEKELYNRRTQLKEVRATLQKEKEALKCDQLEWRNRRDNLVNLERSLSSRESKLESLSAGRPDIEHARAALNEAKTNASREVHKMVLKMLTKMGQLRAIYVDDSLLRIALQGLRETLSKAESQLHDAQQKLQDNLALLEGRATRFREVMRELARAKEVLQEQCGISTIDPDKITQEEGNILEQLEKLFVQKKIPDDKEAVSRLLEEEKVKLDIASVDGSKDDVDRFESLSVEKVNLLERKQQQESTRESWKTTLIKEITNWKEPVEELIRNINVNYSKFFALLGCAGEVYLDIPEDPLNVSEYGIMIMVSFRAGERLRRLDHQVQSGGERSVSTMLYLLALQELCPVPFRCVDEINQGMDPVNERKVFDIMVDTLSGEGNLAKTQYFLLTPKLLHGLRFNRKVTVQIVHNGATLSENCRNWDPKHFLSIMQSRSNTCSR